MWALHGKRMFKKEEDKYAAFAAAAMVVGTEAGVERGRERAGLPLARAASVAAPITTIPASASGVKLMRTMPVTDITATKWRRGTRKTATLQ